MAATLRRARFCIHGDILRADIHPRLQWKGRLGRGAERIALPGQLRQFRQQTALVSQSTAIMLGVSRKRPVLIIISHGEDASASGQCQPAMTTEP